MMRQTHDYKVVDVFSTRPLSGNPVAVVFDADDLDTETMQSIANWVNLSETTFVLLPTTLEADYRLRIFTPRSELPFAGHPTLGTAHALLESGRVMVREGTRLVQQCSAGLVDVMIENVLNEGQQISFTLPFAHIEPLSAVDALELALILGCPLKHKAAPAIVNVGPIWVVVPMTDASAVLALQPDFARLSAFERRLGITGLIVFGKYPHGDVAIEVRAFAPSCGVEEDPVCGSGNASVAFFQRESGLLSANATSYIATQGRSVGRDGRVSVHVSADGQVRVGGSCVTCIDGLLQL